MPEWLQVSITVASIAITIALLVRQLLRARKEVRVRPRLDAVRIIVQLAAVIVVAVLLGAGAPVGALVLLALIAAAAGYFQGRNLEIIDKDGRLYAARNTVAVGVWAVGLVLMQIAGLLRRTGLVNFGQATAWVGVGLAIGLFAGRRGALGEFRRAPAGLAVPAATVGLLVVSLLAVGHSDPADAQSADNGDRWVLTSTDVNVDGAEPPDGWQVTMSETSMTVVQGFSGGNPSGAEAVFDATWTPPAETLVPGDPLGIPVTVSARNAGNLDTQYFFGLDVIMIVNGGWNREAVGANASCAQTTVISGIYECTEPETTSGEMTAMVSTFGDEYSIGVGALNCGGACYVQWNYTLEAGDAAPVGDVEGLVYELVDTVVAPGDRPAPRDNDSVSDGAIHVEVFSNSTNPDAPVGIYDVTWAPPPDRVVGGTTESIAINVSASLAGSSDMIIAEYIDLGVWIFEEFNSSEIPNFMPACGEPCAEVWGSPALTGSSTYDLTFDVPPNRDEFTVTLTATCRREPNDERWPCAVQYVYGSTGEFVGGAGGSDLDDLEEFIDRQVDETGIEPDEAMSAALAGVMAALASGGISLVEAMDQVSRIFEEAADYERKPQIPDPFDPDRLDDQGVMDEFVTDDEPPDDESVARSGSEFEGDIADYIQRLPAPGEGVDIGPYLEWMSEQGEHWNRPFDPEEFARVWDALGSAADDPSAATADELRHALADLLDRQVGGVPSWMVSWAMRNPAAAAEMTARMGAAYATGGASEIALIPWDVNRDITAARDAALARGEDFTFEDALIAGAQGQVIGLVVDGAGAAGNAWRGAGGAGETLAEVAARTEARAAGRGVGDGLEEGLEGLGRSVDAEDLADAARRNTDADGWRGMENEKPGSKIPPEHIRETGYTPEQAAELQRVAAEQNVIIGTRETNLDATRWIEAGEAIPKPMAVKAKTVNELDALIGGPPADKKGLVGFFEPTEPRMPRGENPALWDRYDQRLAEWQKLKPEMEMMENAGYQVRDGVVSKTMPDGSTKPFAGDIDAVAILDGKTGKPLSPARYREVVEELKQSGAQLQHGAETNVVNDIIAHETRGLERGTREYNQAFDKAMDKATALGRKLDENHLTGKEQVFWTHGRGTYKGPQLGKLSQWQAMTAGDIPTRMADPTEIAAALRPVMAAVENEQLDN